MSHAGVTVAHAGLIAIEHSKLAAGIAARRVGARSGL